MACTGLKLTEGKEGEGRAGKGVKEGMERKVGESGEERRGGSEGKEMCAPQNEFLATPMPTSLQYRRKARYLTLLTQGIGLIFRMILVLISKCD